MVSPKKQERVKRVGEGRKVKYLSPRHTNQRKQMYWVGAFKNSRLSTNTGITTKGELPDPNSASAERRNRGKWPTGRSSGNKITTGDQGAG